MDEPGYDKKVKDKLKPTSREAYDATGSTQEIGTDPAQDSDLKDMIWLQVQAVQPLVVKESHKLEDRDEALSDGVELQRAAKEAEGGAIDADGVAAVAETLKRGEQARLLVIQERQGHGADEIGLGECVAGAERSGTRDGARAGDGAGGDLRLVTDGSDVNGERCARDRYCWHDFSLCWAGRSPRLG
jgi:hypothetical protein